jgi:hypothetical protein
MPVTYIPLATQTLGSAAATVTFSSISAAYTDLVLVVSPAVSSGVDNMRIRVGNGTVDSGSNYSYTALTGNGSTAVSARASNETSVLTDYNGYMNTTLGNVTKVINFQNYSNTTTNKTVLMRSNNAATGTDAMVSLWRSTAAINIITLFVSGGVANFAAGSTFSLYGVASSAVGAKATGGTIFNDGTYYYHAFLSSGTFTPSSTLSCDYLIVAGGGGGGGQQGGGGGAGGLRAFANQSISTAQTVTIGAGGTGGLDSGNTGKTNGSNTTFNSTSVSGGGYGAANSAGGNANSGGSGGGAGIGGTTNGSGNTGTYSPVEGFAGGATSSGDGGAGGGGAGAAGTAKNSSGNGRPGGIGASVYNSIDFTSWLSATGTGDAGKLAGGGGGGTTSSQSPGAGGDGGGGDGANNDTGTKPQASQAGLANTGGGGGGGSQYTNGSGQGGNGGSGLVIIRYPV